MRKRSETHSEREIKKGWYKGEGEKKGDMKGPGKQEENRREKMERGNKKKLSKVAIQRRE